MNAPKGGIVGYGGPFRNDMSCCGGWRDIVDARVASRPMSAGPRAYWSGFLLTAILLAPTLVSLVHRVRHDEGDFSEFREDGQIALETRRLGPNLPLSYPPTTRPLFMLMALPPRVIAAVVWWSASVWMYWQTAVWSAQRWIRPAPNRLIAAAIVILLSGLVGIIADLTVGQLTGLVLFCIMAAFEFSRRLRPIGAGAALAVPLIVKPLPIVLLPYFALRRQWTTLLVTALVWIAIGPMLGAIIFGWPNEIEGWRHFRSGTAGPRSPWKYFRDWESRPAGDETYRRSGLSSTLVRLFRPVTYDGRGGSVQIGTLSSRDIFLIWLSVVGGVAGWSAWIAVRGGPAETERAFAGFVAAMLLANPHFISYWLAVGILPAAVLIGRIAALRTPNASKPDTFIAAAALVIWAASLIAFAFPVCRAAGSVVVGVLALAIGVLVPDDCVRRILAKPHVA